MHGIPTYRIIMSYYDNMNKDDFKLWAEVNRKFRSDNYSDGNYNIRGRSHLNDPILRAMLIRDRTQRLKEWRKECEKQKTDDGHSKSDQ